MGVGICDSATIRRIAAVQAIANGTGQLVLLLIADDAGATAYAGTWADSETTYGGMSPRLLVNGAPMSAKAQGTPEPSSLILAWLAALALLTQRHRPNY